ncbi:MAG: hypothetical protein J1F36_00085 [Clostridiales bacterium]|nr:hypothetical protein [Clostridiales bacterium]
MHILFLLMYFIGIFLMGAGGFFLGMQNSTLGIILGGVGLLFIIAGAFASSLPRKNVKKKRTEFTLWCRCDKAKAQEIIDNFMREKDYVAIKYGDEDVYKKGSGWWTARKFIKCEICDNNTMIVEGWISAGIGNKPNTEIDLNGFYGALPKNAVRGDIAELEQRLRNISEYYKKLEEEQITN